VADDQFPILRVFASWPADAKLDRSKPKPPKTTRKPADNANSCKTKKDDDLHPLASLDLEIFVRISEEMDVKWFRRLVERNEVIQMKRSANEGIGGSGQRSDDMVL
jgi:hypothetical protein